MNNQVTDVKNLYHKLNHHLFDGLLPADYQIIFVKLSELPVEDGDESGEHLKESHTINLSATLKDRPQSLHRMLVHEMVHAAESDEHDEAFFNRLLDIARRGEEWAWDEARDYHPCAVRTLIHAWRKFHPDLLNELDPRKHCKCKACNGWQSRGCPYDESLEQWRPWEPLDGPVHPHADWIEMRAFELVEGGKCEGFLGAWRRARQEAELL